MPTFIKSKNTTTKMMLNVIVALIPIIVFSFYKNGVVPYSKGFTNVYGMFYPIIFIVISTFATFMIETIYQLIFDKKKNFKEILCNSYAYMPGLFLGLILPINTPISVLIVGCFCASIIGKILFGGFGKNIFNPALIGRLFIISAYALVITENGGCFNPMEVDTISSATPLTKASMLTGIGTYNELVAPFGNLWDFFIGNIPGTIGETSSLLCIIAFIYLTFTKTIKWRIPVCYVGVVFFMSFIIALYNNTGIWYPLFQIFSGGLMFGAVFMATDPVTSPTTKVGQTIYGICLGILTVTLRHLTQYPEGVLTSILTMNMLISIIDSIGVKAKFNKNAIIIPIIVLVILFTSMSFVIASKKNTTIVTDPNFKIISKEVEGYKTTYVVSEKGYSSNLKLEIVLENDLIISTTILEQNDSFFNKVIDSDYINILISNQKDLENCDTVSGATISSTALKKALINTLIDYRGE